MGSLDEPWESWLSAALRQREQTRGALAGGRRAHRLRTGRTQGLVFGRTAEEPLRPEGVLKRADTAWRRAGLNRITLHERRHSFAPMMIDAGVNAMALSTYMGHANISITLDRYGHLMPGNEEEAAERFNAYLTRSSTRPMSEPGQLIPRPNRATLASSLAHFLAHAQSQRQKRPATSGLSG